MALKDWACNEKVRLLVLFIGHLKLLPATPQTHEYLVTKRPD
jgi:hypothetical protein